MNKAELSVRKDALMNELAKLPESASYTNCEHFGAGGICNEFEQVVPQEFQAQGCDSWEFDGVPF